MRIIEHNHFSPKPASNRLPTPLFHLSVLAVESREATREISQAQRAWKIRPGTSSSRRDDGCVVHPCLNGIFRSWFPRFLASLLSKSNPASLNREAIKSQMDCDLLRPQFYHAPFRCQINPVAANVSFAANSVFVPQPPTFNIQLLTLNQRFTSSSSRRNV
jgi:hypothetical protein